LSITEIRLLSGWLPENGAGNEREKDKNNSPFEGVEGVERKREENNLFMACTQISTQNVWKFGFLYLSLPRTLEP
jgi:hypothetical protein